MPFVYVLEVLQTVRYSFDVYVLEVLQTVRYSFDKAYVSYLYAHWHKMTKKVPTGLRKGWTSRETHDLGAASGAAGLRKRKPRATSQLAEC